MACLPATFASAYFVAIILLDLYQREWRRIPGHALFGVFAVLLLGFICEKASSGVAWILLFAPFLFILLGFIFRLIFSLDLKSFLSRMFTTKKKEESYQPDEAPCPCCYHMPCDCRSPCPKPVVPSCPPGGSGSSGGSIPPFIPKPPKPQPPKPGSCIKGTLAD